MVAGAVAAAQAGPGSAAASVVVRLDDYRRNTWSAADLTWEHVALKAVAALARGERLTAAVLLPQADSIARLHTPADDPRRAATLTLLARAQAGLGDAEAAERLRAQAQAAWRVAAAGWVERLRPGGGPEGQAECRWMAARALAASASLDVRGGLPASELDSAALAGLPADRRKLEVAVAVATASLEGGGAAPGGEAAPGAS
jgi:hypothetical protein